MKRLMILLHGLPGAGKSTLARGVASSIDGLYYADLGAHPDFGKRSMIELCVELYDQNGIGRSLLTEGVFRSTSSRDSFVRHVVRHAQQRHPFDAAIIFRLVVDLEVLTSRRNRSLADYEKIDRKS